MLKKVIKLNLDDFAISAAIVAGFFLVAEVIVGIVMAAVKPDSVPTLGGILLPIVAMMACLFINMFQIPLSFDFMLRFGVTRRSALGCTLALMALETVAPFTVALLLVQADRLIANLWLLARPELFLEEFSIPLWGVALMAAATVLLGFLGGAALQYFGRKAMWVLWAVWMAFILLMNVAGWDELENFESIPPAAIAVAAIALLCAVVWSAWSLLRASVKN